MHNSKENWHEDGERHQGRPPGRGSAHAKIKTGNGQEERREVHREVFSFQNKVGHETRNLMPFGEW